MAKNIDLFELIHSLSKNERKLVLLQMKQNGSPKSKRYFKHFEEISKMKSYNALVWKRKLSYGKSIKSISWTNSYLYDLIINVLISLRKKTLERQIALTELQKIDLLISRGFYNQADTMIQSFKKFAKEHELFEICLDVIRVERSIIRLIGDYSKDRFQELKQEWKGINELMVNDHEYRCFEMDTNFLYKEHHIIRNSSIEKRFRELLDNDLLKDFSYAKTIHSKYTFITKNLILNSFLGNHQAANLYSRMGMDFLVEYGDKLKNPMYNCSILVRELELIILHERWEDFEFTYDMFLDLEPKLKNASYKAYWFINKSLFDVQHAIIKKEEKEIESIIENIPVRKYNKSFISHPSICHRLVFEIAKFNLSIRNYEKAHFYLQKIIDNKTRCRRDILIATRLLVLIVHYESKDFLYIPYAVKSFYRQIKKMDYLYEGEKSIIKFLRTIASLPIQEDIIPYLNKLNEDLKAYQKDKYELGFFYYFDYSKWIESQIEIGL